jgi:hypothetical protein
MFAKTGELPFAKTKGELPFAFVALVGADGIEPPTYAL